MISSEVQRTLVKSPPELWAELSDPAALARHLGELGEIRITRIEPEQLVEWEAENRTGTVHIKPSGWGTRVTLTVATELPDASAQEVPPAAEPAAEPLSTAPEAAPVAAEDPEPPATHAPVRHPDDEPAGYFESVPSPLGAPLTAAAASSWRHEAEPEAAEAPHAYERDEDEAASTSQTGEEDEGRSWLPYEQPEPRRGFFARLFGRRRRTTAGDGEAAGPLSFASDSDEQIEQQPPPAGYPDAGLATDAAEPAVQAIPAPQPPQEPGASDVPQAEIEPLGAQPGDEAPGEGIPDSAVAEPEAVEADSEAIEAESPAVLPDPQAVEAEPETVSPEPVRGEPAGDIAGELKAAEEIAEAEVTAVLTSVLDRLGAAHHRPFSRS